jgi:hypothetical protein
MKLHAAISEFFGALDSAARVAERYRLTDARLQALTWGFRSAIADLSLLIY